MSEPTNTPAPEPAVSSAAESSPQTPAPAAVSGSGGVAKIEAAPLLELADDSCPKCGAPMAADAVVCMKCGYDMKGNTTLATAKAVEYQEDSPSSHPFVQPAWDTPKMLLVIGAVLGILAMVFAGANVQAGKTVWLVIGSVVLVVYELFVHTGTGVVALAATARICEQKFGDFELGVTRMFAAFSAFELAFHLSKRIPHVGFGLAFVLGPCVYWLVIWGLFRKNHVVTTLVVLCHIVLWLVITFGMMLSAQVGAALAAPAASGTGS